VINHIFQPPGSSLCGQTCVAMIADITMEESIKAFGGKKACTRTKDIITALKKLGIDCGDPPLIRMKGQELPDNCIVKLRFDDRKNTHWTLWHKGQFYDPEEHVAVFMKKYLNSNKYWEGVRQTSYLPIFME
jgi:hypothetical protein